MPVLRATLFIARYWLTMRQGGWEGRYQREVRRRQRMNTCKYLESRPVAAEEGFVYYTFGEDV